MPGLLLHSPAHILSQWIIDSGLGSDGGNYPLTTWPVFYGDRMPDSPDKIINIIDSDGLLGLRIQFDGSRDELHGFSMAVRSPEREGWAKARQIRVALDQIYMAHVTVEDIIYIIHSSALVSDVVSSGKEPTPTKRSVFNVSGQIQVEPLA